MIDHLHAQPPTGRPQLAREGEVLAVRSDTATAGMVVGDHHRRRSPLLGDSNQRFRVLLVTVKIARSHLFANHSQGCVQQQERHPRGR